MRNALIRGLAVALVGVSALGASAQEAQDQPLQLYAHQAADHIGEMALVCGVIASTRYAYDSNGAPTYLNFDKPYPQNEFTVVVWGRDRGNFSYKPEDLKDHQACVYGRIDEYRGKPQVIAIRPEQILHKPPATTAED